MNIIPGITILLLFQLFGEAMVIVFQLPVPGPVLGMLALLTTLVIRKGWQGSLEPVSQVILRHFSLLFVPAGIGVILHFQRFENEWFAIGSTVHQHSNRIERYRLANGTGGALSAFN